MMGFENFPIALDGVEFGREPVRARQRGARGLAGVNRAVIESNRGGLARCRRFGERTWSDPAARETEEAAESRKRGVLDFIKPLQQGDAIGEEVLRIGPGSTATPSSSRAARQRGAARGRARFQQGVRARRSPRHPSSRFFATGPELRSAGPRPALPGHGRDGDGPALPIHRQKAAPCPPPWRAVSSIAAAGPSGSRPAHPGGLSKCGGAACRQSPLFARHRRKTRARDAGSGAPFNLLRQARKRPAFNARDATRMKVERQSRTVSSRTLRNLCPQSFLRPKTSPMGALFQPESESRTGRARPAQAQARFTAAASRSSPKRNSATRFGFSVITLSRITRTSTDTAKRTRGASARSRAPARWSLLELVPKRGALVTSVKVGFDHRRRWDQRLELVGYRAVRSPDRLTRRVRVSRLRELRPIADHRIGKLLLHGRKWCHRQVEKLARE